MHGPLVTDDALMHEVHPGLWLGGSWMPYPTDARFDVVLTVCGTWEAHRAPTCGNEIIVTLEDDERAQQDEDIAYAVEVAQAVLALGQTLLVRCYAGQNRSALVVATVLAAVTGQSGADVLAHLRGVRGQHVLWNKTFEAAVIAIPAAAG